MTSATTWRGSAAIVMPAVLWAIHFLVVYVYVSLACLWNWPGIKLAVAVITAGFVAAILWIGWDAWRVWRDLGVHPDDTPTKRRRFIALSVTAQGILFAIATLMVGGPTLLVPACH